MLAIRHNKIIIVLFWLITAVLCSRLGNLVIVIDPDESLPKDHPFVMATKQIEKVFGNQFSAVIAITPREGDIFQPVVIDTMTRLTRAIEASPGVVRTNMASLAARKFKSIKGSDEGMEVHRASSKSPRQAHGPTQW
ncbi:MAG: hypothetical protein G8237_13695 [Magnetococcales bacterium]|nr:hypothetical protein [Magnetococcales bacterium]